MSNIKIETSYRTTSNGAPYTGKSYERPGFFAAVVVGDIESFMVRADDRMTFYPSDVREIAAALHELANYMEQVEQLPPWNGWPTDADRNFNE